MAYDDGQVSDRLGEHFGAVLASARSGSGWAAERIWMSVAPAVAGYLRVQGAADPDGLASDVLLGVLRSLGAFSGTEAELRAWALTIAHRRLVEDSRGSAHGRQLAPAGWDDGEAPDWQSAEQEVLRQLCDDRVHALCQRLAQDQRDVVLLRLVGGLTETGVAEALGRSEGAVRALQRRAVRSLRRIVAREGVPL